MNRLSRAISLSVIALWTLGTPAFAESLKVTSLAGDVLATFDQNSIERLGLRKIETETPWTEGVVTFEGVALKRILAEAGVTAKSVTGYAMDDYAVTITAEIIETLDLIVATRMNGTLMSIEDRGPFWIMFDLDELPPETATEMRSYAVWHLNELEVE